VQSVDLRSSLLRAVAEVVKILPEEENKALASALQSLTGASL
jgi:hypothetical protein